MKEKFKNILICALIMAAAILLGWLLSKASWASMLKWPTIILLAIALLLHLTILWVAKRAAQADNARALRIALRCFQACVILDAVCAVMGIAQIFAR